MARAFTAGACDYAMLNIMRIGGLTGWLAAAGLARGMNVPLSSHINPEFSAHALSASPTAHWLEYADVAGAGLQEALKPEAGHVKARGPGFGVVWDEDAITKHAA
jgi:mandelate racemase